MSRKKSKRHEQKNRAASEKHERGIELSNNKDHVVVSGKIEAPPKLVEKYDADRDEQRIGERKKFKLKLFTLIGVFTAAAFTLLQAYLIRESNKITREALVSSSRAWIAPANAYFTSDVAKNVPFSFEVQYRNTGRSPALGAHPIYTLQQVPVSKFEDNTFNAFIEADKASDDCTHLGLAPGADVIYPDQPDGYKLLFTNHLTNWINDDVISGKTAVVLQVCFAYQTMREIHRTAFCYFYRAGTSPANKQMNICTAGNHAD